MQHRGRVRRYGGGASADGILRRRGDFLESASDTEAQQESCWTMGKRRGAAQYGGRSHSLPRCLRSGGFGGGRQHHQAVRFSTYDSQEESDGAVSAPELPATRSLRRREYNQFFHCILHTMVPEIVVSLRSVLHSANPVRFVYTNHSKNGTCILFLCVVLNQVLTSVLNAAAGAVYCSIFFTLNSLNNSNI